MDRLIETKDIVLRIVQEYAGHKPSVGEVDSYTLIDAERGHYVAMQVGWVRDYRVHGAFLHLDVIDGKVWVQFDGTDRPVAEALVAAGIPKEDIVLAEQPSDARPLTGYGVA